MAAAVLARRVTWLRARIAKASPSAAVFSPCPWFLLILIVVLLVGEAGALSFRLPAPHTTIPPLGVLLVSLIMLVFFASISLPRNLPEWGYCVAACLILPLGNTIMPAALAEAIAFLPHVYDANVVELDGTLGVQPSFVVGALFVRFPDLAWLCAAIYAGVLLPTAILALAEGHHGQRTGLGALSTFLVIAGAGYVIYHILPVIGPVPYFGDTFPLQSTRAHLPAPRNCMPSLHTAWVLMAFLTSRGMPLARLISGLWLALMLLATLGFGEHYLTDLVCAAPFVLALRALCASDLPWSARARWSSAVAGVAVFCVWGLAIRGAIEPAGIPGLVPAMMIATVTLCVIWERRLARAQGLLNPLRPLVVAGLN
jgi:hypothetical protein